MWQFISADKVAFIDWFEKKKKISGSNLKAYFFLWSYLACKRLNSDFSVNMNAQLNKMTIHTDGSTKIQI